MRCSRNLIFFLTCDKFLSCTCQKWRLPVGPYQIQQIHFLSRYRSHAGGGYYSVCLSACDFLLPVRSGCYASSACCLLPPVPLLPGHILLFPYLDRNTWSVKGIPLWHPAFLIRLDLVRTPLHEMRGCEVHLFGGEEERKNVFIISEVATLTTPAEVVVVL